MKYWNLKLGLDHESQTFINLVLIRAYLLLNFLKNWALASYFSCVYTEQKPSVVKCQPQDYVNRIISWIQKATIR